MKQKSIKLSIILLISVLVVSFTSANNQKKVVQKKKSESYFKITKIIDHGFKEPKKASDFDYIIEFEVLNNSNLTITKTLFEADIFIPNSKKGEYSAVNGRVPDIMSEYNKDDWRPKTLKTIKIGMYKRLYSLGFDYTPEYATLIIKFTGGDIDKSITDYLIDKFNVIEDWKEYQRKIGLRQ